ncbi:hypothetical protein NZD85_12290 [Empedobacter stercoris]|uniref:hypothetical protein n=1 Tax=Empedobacter TaxID=59734 RepID=UPI001DCEDFD1|nr:MULTISPECIES: hypothetical protein [Empedobacter]MDM1522671.1 hypothetical protein [Empedobacter sp. 225-1]MDM1543739.1 hypothetical protein [Empedobacter sp. 189-2]UWX66648.1 hypothetical protein NZD85_12290 [Empedobacter stercoris]HJD86368.1 hypothetical protein [Empedobacter falsenii]
MKNDLKNNFKVPDHYFDDLQNELYLNSFKQKENLTVPNQYFNDLEENIIAKTINKKETKVIHFTKWWAVACLIFIALIALPFMINSSQKSQEVVDTKTEIQVYEKIYDSYIVSDQNKKSSNETLDDSDFVLYNY